MEKETKSLWKKTYIFVKRFLPILTVSYLRCDTLVKFSLRPTPF